MQYNITKIRGRGTYIYIFFRSAPPLSGAKRSLRFGLLLRYFACRIFKDGKHIFQKLDSNVCSQKIFPHFK